MIDGERNGEKLQFGFQRLLLIYVAAGFEGEHHRRNNMAAAAYAAVTSRVITACALAGRGRNACVGDVASIRACAYHTEQADGSDAE